jgi:hypothetical protein
LAERTTNSLEKAVLLAEEKIINNEGRWNVPYPILKIYCILSLRGIDSKFKGILKLFVCFQEKTYFAVRRVLRKNGGVFCSYVNESFEYCSSGVFF